METEKYPEVRELLQSLIDKGVTLVGYDDGDGQLFTTNDLNAIVEAVHSVEESTVDISLNNHMGYLYFVMGNEPGVALSDYGVGNTLGPIIDEVSETIYNKYNN